MLGSSLVSSLSSYGLRGGVIGRGLICGTGIFNIPPLGGEMELLLLLLFALAVRASGVKVIGVNVLLEPLAFIF